MQTHILYQKKYLKATSHLNDPEYGNPFNPARNNLSNGKKKQNMNREKK